MSETKKEGIKEAAAKEKTEKKAETRGREETVIYIGPSIKNVVSANTIFTNGLPEALKDKIKENIAVKSLIVPVEKLVQAQKELAVSGSALETIYQTVKKGQEEK